MVRQTGRHDNFKANRVDYDFVFGKSDGDDFPVCLSWRERQALLSIIDSLAWPTRWVKSEGTVDTDEIEQLRNQIAYKLMGECAVNCQDVLQCLADDFDGEGDFWASIIALLIDQLTNNPEVRDIVQGNPGGDDPIGAGDTNLLGGFGCSLDDTFGFALQFTQMIHFLVLDFYEILEVATNWLEAIAAAVDSVPGLTEYTDALAYLQNNIIENYNANYDQALENEIACDFFCLALQNDCSLTWDDVYFFLGRKVSAQFEALTLSDFITYLIGGIWNGDEFVYVSFLLLATVLKYGGDWAGITLEDIQRIVTSLFNDPNSDWEQLCDECAWCWTFDFTTTCPDVWTYFGSGTGSPWGECVTGGMTGTAEGVNKRLYAKLEFDELEVQKVELTYSLAGCDGSPEQKTIALLLSDVEQDSVTEMNLDTSADHVTFTWVGNEQADEIWVQFIMGAGNVTLHSVKICAVGTNPWE